MSEQNSVLRRLCQYYLSCIANDNAGGVSVVMRPGPEPEYVELSRVDLDAPTLPPWDEKLAAFVHGARARDKGTLRLGYPVFAPKGAPDASGTPRGPRKLLPLFLIDVAVDRQRLEPDWHTAALNLEALRELEGNGIEFAQHSLLELEEGLGLTANGQPKPFAQIVEMLKLLRPEWPWADLDPPDQPLAPLYASPSGLIYQRAIVLRVLRPYTQGLELELQKLSELPESALKGTALGALLFGEEAKPTRREDSTPLLEVLPMNPEQRAAVRLALTEPLTVITGPPGNGKSQVVANLLVNCTWRRRAVLFTSKNNKAVDVVEERVNGLGKKPVMVRLGAKEHRRKLAEHLAHLVNGTVTAETLENLNAEQLTYNHLEEEIAKVDEAERTALVLHDQAIRLAREIEELGIPGNPSNRAIAAAIDTSATRSLLYRTRDALLATVRKDKGNSRWVRATWPLWRRRRRARFEQLREHLSTALGEFAPADTPNGDPNVSLEAFKTDLNHCARVLAAIERLASYDTSLLGLREASFGALAERRNALQDALVQTSSRLWQAWVEAQPALLSADQRLMLSRYSAVLKSVLEAGNADLLPFEVRKEYDRITLEAPEVVSCFAVTALSARNRVPFTPGYFDLVVFDESSQCDLASALPILFRAKRAAIIGDPQQLKHIANLRRDRDAAYLVEQQLEQSHLDWQYSTQSLFELVASRAAESAKVSLRDHHRSHPHVIGYSNRAFYGDALRIVTELPRLKRSGAEGPAVRWIDVRGKPTRGNQGSVFNAQELRVVVDAVKDLVKAGYEGTIGVVTPFAYQAERIRRELEKDPKLWETLRRNHEFQSTTAHGFQGDERDIMLFSIVAAAGVHEGAVRFLEDEANVFNVALTRARAELIVAGDLSWCLDAPVEHLSGFARYALSLSDSAARGKQRVEDVASECLSAEEQRLKGALQAEGFVVQARADVEQYATDLAISSEGRNLAIDVRDKATEGDWGAEALEREQLKRQRLLRLGWSTGRYWPLQVRDDLAWCVEDVKRWAGRMPPVGDASERRGEMAALQTADC